MPTQKNRREFLKQSGLTIGAVAIFGSLSGALEGCATGLRARNTAPNMDVDITPLTSDGMALVAIDPGPDGASVLIHRESASQYSAYSMKCTHRGCNVNPPNATGVLFCPCHGSQFDSAGKVIHGPASENLQSYPTTYDAAKRSVKVDFLHQS